MYSYLLLVIVSLALGLGAQAYVKGMISKYQRVPSSFGITGAEAAARMLAYHGIEGVAINQGGAGQDFFDPRTNSVTLDPDAYHGRSITAIATACHEVGHACQFAQGYAPMKFRSALVPAVNFASNAWIYLLLIGIFMQLLSLQYLAITFYAVAVLFQIVTLPVEFDASSRALKYLTAVGLPQGEHAGVFSVLRACALTYVAAALVSVLQLIYLLSARRD